MNQSQSPHVTTGVWDSFGTSGAKVYKVNERLQSAEQLGPIRSFADLSDTRAATLTL
jgi:hypothetical protein